MGGNQNGNFIFDGGNIFELIYDVMFVSYIYIEIIVMKKLSINYGRTFPDHRVPIDYNFNNRLLKSPASYLRV